MPSPYGPCDKQNSRCADDEFHGPETQKPARVLTGGRKTDYVIQGTKLGADFPCVKGLADAAPVSVAIGRLLAIAIWTDKLKIT